MKEIKEFKKEEQDYVEAELLDGPALKENRSYGRPRPNNGKKPGFFSKAAAKAKKTVFLSLFFLGFSFLILGSFLTLSVIGALAGIPLIILGLMIIFAAIRFFSESVFLKF